MGLLKRPNVVSTVTIHESDVSEGPETHENVLLLSRGYTIIDPSILAKIIPARSQL